MSGVVLLSKLLPMMREVLHPPVWIAVKNKPLMSVKSNGEQFKENFPISAKIMLEQPQEWIKRVLNQPTSYPTNRYYVPSIKHWNMLVQWTNEREKQFAPSFFEPRHS